MVARGSDINAFNAHKIYGPLMYPFLTTNWKFEWPTRGKLKTWFRSNISYSYQTKKELIQTLIKSQSFSNLSLSLKKLLHFGDNLL